MAQQPQVGVGRRQEHPPAVDHHVSTIEGLNGFEVRVDSSRLYVAYAVSKLPDAPLDRIHAPTSRMLRDEGARPPCWAAAPRDSLPLEGQGTGRNQPGGVRRPPPPRRSWPPTSLKS